VSELDGRTALVTGASRGIGLAVADALEAAGARVVRVARSVEGRQGGERRVELRCDVSREEEVLRLADTVRRRFGPPDILVNNAGAFVLQPLVQTTAEEFRRQLDVNLVGAFLVLRALVPAMAERGGHVVTIGSISDHTAYPGNAGYAASKFGLRGLHETVKAEYADSGLRFTLVSPGPTDTSLWDPVDPDGRDDLPSRARMLRASDVADAVRFAVTRPPRANVELLRLMPA
jgi:NAD(P)-dependent dehydrogenase (short-subunit alcohol dehydrogenase family)